MRPRLLGIHVLSHDEEARIYGISQDLAKMNPGYDVHLECFLSEECDPPHDAVLEAVKNEAFEVVVLYGSFLPQQLLSLMQSLAPDVEVVNWADMESSLDVYLRMVFRSPNRLMLKIAHMMTQAHA